MLNRRNLLIHAANASIASTLMPVAAYAKTVPVNPKLAEILKDFDKGSNARLGVCVIDTHTGQQTGLRMSERFPMCSTFKFLLAAAILARVDAGKEKLERRIVFEKAGLAAYSPVTNKHVGGDGMSLAELCEAAITLSDNTAANLLLKITNGPNGLTRQIRGFGDTVTRLDRWEPELNQAIPGDKRDTTSPAAMAATMQKLLLGKQLSDQSRERLTNWLIATKTGDKRIRAGLPPEWRIGDKTGTGEHGSTNDVAIIWPPDRSPVIVAAFMTGGTIPASLREIPLASLGGMVSATLDSGR